jgi:hypothetical protein
MTAATEMWANKCAEQAAEIERLRAENRCLHDTVRWHIKCGHAPGELLICVGGHHRDEPCDFYSYIARGNQWLITRHG